MQKCNCFTEKLAHIESTLKKGLPPEVSEFAIAWEGSALMLSGGSIPASLKVNYEFRGIKKDKTPKAKLTKESLRVMFSYCPLCGKKTSEHTADSAVETVRDAIQVAEEFGVVRTEYGRVITGAITTDDGIVLVEDK